MNGCKRNTQIEKKTFLGGIKAFVGNNESVLKWCIDISGKTVSRTLNLAGLDPSNDPYKPLHPAEIISSEKHVRNVMSVLEAEYLRVR